MLTKIFKKIPIITLSVLGSICLITIPIIIYVNQQSQKSKFIPPEFMQAKEIDKYGVSHTSSSGVNITIPMVKVEYTAYRFNYIEPALQPPLKGYVGRDCHVAKYVQNEPFNNWYDGWTDKFKPSFEKAGLGTCLFKTHDYDFEVEISKELHTITITVDCPKYLLEQDRDYYIGDIMLPCHWMDISSKHFPLHFNPVKRTLSLYENPRNFKE